MSSSHLCVSWKFMTMEYASRYTLRCAFDHFWNIILENEIKLSWALTTYLGGKYSIGNCARIYQHTYTHTRTHIHIDCVILSLLVNVRGQWAIWVLMCWDSCRSHLVKWFNYKQSLSLSSGLYFDGSAMHIVT